DLAVGRVAERGDRVPAHAVDHLDPQVATNCPAHRGLEAAIVHGPAQPHDALGLRSVRLTDWVARSGAILADDAGLDHLGPGPEDAADRPFRSEHLPLPATRVETLQPQIFVRTGLAVEIPVRNTGGRRNHRRVRAEERLHRIERIRHLVGFQRDEDVVLRSKLRSVAGRLDRDGEILVWRYDAKPLALHRLQVRAAGDHTHLDIGSGEMARDVAADCTGTVDTDFHFSSGSGVRGQTAV